MEIFIPSVLGILLAKYWNNFPTVIVVSILPFCICYGYFFRNRKRFFLYCFLVSAIYAFLRFEGTILLEQKQIWSLTYDVKIEKIDLKSERAKIYGYGKIVKVYNKKYKMLKGHRIYFYLNGDEDYIPSQVLKLHSGIRFLKPATSETFFSYLTQKNIYLYGYRGKVLKISAKENIFWHFFAKINRMLHDQIEYYIQKHGSHSTDGILYGILLSEKKKLSKEQKMNFHNTSAAHLLAVSGLHIGVIGFALDFLLRCFFLKRSWRRWLIIGILLFYVGAIGFPPSAVRAWLMLTCFWSAGFCLRKSSGLSSLLLAAILMLLYDPILLFDIGFQLSYGVVAMLLLLSAPLQQVTLWFLRKIRCSVLPVTKLYKTRIISWKIAELLSVSMAATLASAPLTFEYFNMFSLVGIFLNPVIIQMALPVVVCGFLFLLLGLLHVHLFLGDILFLLARKGVSWINGLLFLAEEYIPWHIEFLTKPNGIGLVFFIFCLIFSLKVYEIHKTYQWRRFH
ncbi:MAG: competence protein ComEC family protein [Puniceicoccales bacterium]|jgi:competence protein ComEC|nr:competence protein ComEC family protein [Puniceicoccales bacterium]